jgi:hypothetical protein
MNTAAPSQSGIKFTLFVNKIEREMLFPQRMFFTIKPIV